MRKNVWKRFLAMALAAVVMFTSVDCTGLVANAEGTTKTLGEIVAEHNKVSDAEKAVLTHPDVMDGDPFNLQAPADLSTKVELDVANKTVKAANAVVGEVTWAPKTVTLIFSDNTEKELTGTNGVYTYTEEGTVKEVKVVYEATVTVPEAVQLNVLNTTYYLVSARDEIENIFDDAELISDAKRIELGSKLMRELVNFFNDAEKMEKIAPAIEAGLLTVPTAAIDAIDRCLTPIENNFKLYSLSEDYAATDVVRFWRANVNELIRSFNDSKDAIDELSEIAALNNLADFFEEMNALPDEFKDMIGTAIMGDVEDALTVVNEFDAALDSYHVNDTVVDFADYIAPALFANKTGYLESELTGSPIILPKRAKEYTSIANGEIIPVATATVTSDAKERVVKLEVSATVIEGNEEVVKTAAKPVEVTVALGTSLEDVKAKAHDAVEAALFEIDGEKYGLLEYTDVYSDLANYTVVVEAGDIAANGVTDNATIKVTYAPKTYNVTCTPDEDGISGEYPYGYEIILPSAAAPNSYDYKVSEEEVYYQGSAYVVKSDVAFTRITNDSVKVSKSEKDVAIATHGDKLTATAKDILANAGVSALKEINSREPENGKGLITFDGDTVIVAGFEDGSYVWTVNKVKFMVGDTVVEEFTKLNDGKVVPTKEYENVVVEYALKIDGVTADEVVNLPVALVDESAAQLNVMNNVAGYASELAKIDDFVLGALKEQLKKGNAKAATIAAVEKIEKDCMGADGKLVLLAYANEYNSKGGYSDKLAYYYDNYAAIKNQVKTLADQLTIVVKDTAALNYLKGVTVAGMELKPYVEMLEEKAGQLSELADRVVAPSSRISTKNESLRNLLANALYAREGKAGYENYKVENVNVSGPLYWVKEVSEAAPSKLAFKVVVQVADGNGNVASYNKVEKEIIFDAETGLTDADVAVIKAAYPELEAKLTFDKFGYTLSTEGEDNIVAGLKKAASVVYTWSPKHYDVTIPGMLTIGFTYDNPVISLPTSGNPNVRFEYVIDGETVPGGSYSFVGKIEKLFGTGNHITIEVKEVNIAAEKENEFFEFLAESVEGSGIAVIPTKDENGAVESVELSIEGSVGSIYSGMMKFMMALFMPSENSYPYYALGGHAVKDGSAITIQGIIDALLTSGVSTEDLAAMFKADGSTVTTPGYNGAVLLETEFTFGETAATFRMSRAAGAVTTVPFVITFKSPAANEAFATLKAGLDIMHKGLVVEGKDGAVVATVKKGVSDEAFEAYLVAMILEGRTTFATVNDVTVEDIIDFEYDRFVGNLEDDNVSITTIENTISKLGKDVDLSEYEATFEKIKAFIYNDGSTASGSVTFKKAANASADEYNMVATAAKDTVLSVVNAGDLASLIADDKYVVPMKVVFDGFEEDHDAFVINDPTALTGITGADKKSVQIALNAWNLVQGNNLSIGPNAAVVLTDNIDEITFAGDGVLDLNGFTVGKVTTSGKVIVLDSTYENSGFATTPVTVGNITMVNESNNLFYSVSKDSAGNTVVKLDAGFLATIAEMNGATVETELVPLVVEIAFDIVMNNIASGKMSINDMGIYELGYADILNVLKETKPSAANKALDFVDYKGISAFVNDMIATITDFAALKSAIETDSVIKTYTAKTNALTVEVATAGTAPEDYLTLNIATAKKAKETTVKLMVGGTAEDKAALAALCGAFAEIVEEFDVTVNLDDVDYVNGGLKTEGAAAKAHIVIDLTKDEDYALAMAMIVAYGNPDNTALLDAINAYLKDGKQSTLKAEVDKITTAQVINAVKAAYGKDFADVAKKLGLEGKVDGAVELEAIYHDLLNVLYRVSGFVANYFGITGGAQQLKGVEDSYGVYGATHTGTHKGVATDVKLVLKIFTKDAAVEEPDDDGPTEVHPVPTPTPTPTPTPGVQTGDSSNLVLWISIMGIAVVAVVLLAMKKRRVR